ncbi:MAG: hypothetical protein RQ745_11080 [Longimicrobiales bacterium]|nr:hypothetical protein [Longimicrobiales bacterium]
MERRIGEENPTNDGPGPFTFRAVIGTLILGLHRKGLITGPLHRARYAQLLAACEEALHDPEAFWAEIPVALHDGRTPQLRDLDREIQRAFLHLWRRAAVGPDYDRSAWEELEALMRRRGWR